MLKDLTSCDCRPETGIRGSDNTFRRLPSLICICVLEESVRMQVWSTLLVQAYLVNAVDSLPGLHQPLRFAFEHCAVPVDDKSAHSCLLHHDTYVLFKTACESASPMHGLLMRIGLSAAGFMLRVRMRWLTGIFHIHDVFDL